MLPFQPRHEPGKWKALTLTVLVHVGLLAALIFGIHWRQQAPEAMSVEVWRAVPSTAAAPPPPPAPPSEDEVRPPKPEPKVEPKPVKPAPVEAPKPVSKPDIAIKQDKNKKQDEKKEEKPAKPERPNFADALQREMAQMERQKSVQNERLRAEQESRQLAQASAEQARLAGGRRLADYSGKIKGKIKGNIVNPPNIVGNPTAVFLVHQLPSGEVMSVKLARSSGVPAYDTAVERAIYKSSPLPLPDDKGDFQPDLRLTICPQEDAAGCSR